ncbi:purine-cytosine permease family protein [Pseudomonas aeruginosa]|uniref:purine-cytosine permease family protein n=1 Tax=Pseudomonas aeruginosa TaxID=287 RepID=UPI00235A3B41|nr:cytosine permease [Pseudomonas aeruginosa]MDY1449798.1 cytosine permease [Pseudomonas aeruginosa]HEJ2935044.1 cytosine permease [Pseudomonas aeruginosa]
MKGHSLDVAADTSAWPLLPAERVWGSWQLLIALTTAGAATWCYIIGEYVGYYLNFRQGFAALTAGCMFGMLLTILAALPTCCRFGVDSIASSKPQFGSRGWVIPASLQFLSILGWNCLLLIFFGKSAAQFLVAVNVIQPVQSAVVEPCATLFACVLVMLLLIKGSGGVDKVAKILVAHVFVGLWMLYIIVNERWEDLAMAKPAYASADPLWNFVTGLELGIASSLSWWPYVGAMSRMVPNGRKAAVPALIGLGGSVAALSLIGVAGVLVLKVSDPSEWLATVGGPTYAIISLAFVTAANLGTAVAGIYCSALGLRHYKVFEEISWKVLLVIIIVPIAVIGLAIPNLFFNNFSTFLAFIGVGFAPLCGIQIADYYLLRRGRINIRGLFDESEPSYQYWKGINPAAVLGMIAGIVTYIYVLNPLTYVSNFPYPMMPASILAALVASAVFILVTRLWIIPAGKGGYTACAKSQNSDVVASSALE